MTIDQDINYLRNSVGKPMEADILQKVKETIQSGDIIKQNIDMMQNQRLDQIETNINQLKQQYESTFGIISKWASGLALIGIKIPSGSYTANIIVTSGNRVNW